MSAIYRFQESVLPALSSVIEEIPLVGPALSFYIDEVGNLIEENIAPGVRNPEGFIQKAEDVPITNELESAIGKQYRGAGDLGPRSLRYIRELQRSRVPTFEPISGPDYNPKLKQIRKGIKTPKQMGPEASLEYIPPPILPPILPPGYPSIYTGFREHYEPMMPEIPIEDEGSYYRPFPPAHDMPNASMNTAGGFVKGVTISRKEPPSVSGFTGRPIYATVPTNFEERKNRRKLRRRRMALVNY